MFKLFHYPFRKVKRTFIRSERFEQSERSERGQSLVEMAVIVPLLLFIFLSLIEVGWAIRGYLVLFTTNRETTRFAARGEALDFSQVDKHNVGYDLVFRHTGNILNNTNNFGLDLSAGEETNNGTFIVSHFLIDTGLPCSPEDITAKKGNGTCLLDSCGPNGGKCDCNNPSDRKKDYAFDDLMLHPDLPGYDYFQYTQPLTSSLTSRIDMTAELQRLKEENDVLNCNIQRRTPGSTNPVLSPNSLIMVEAFYAQPQLLGLPFLSNSYTDPISLYNLSKMRITSDKLPQGGGCELMPIALEEAELNKFAVGDFIPDILNGAGTGAKGWLRWNSESQTEAIEAQNGSTKSAEYLDAEINNNRLSMTDYVNPKDTTDTVLNAGNLPEGDWVATIQGTKSSSAFQELAALGTPLDVVVPVWDKAEGTGVDINYHIVGFARLRLMAVNFGPSSSDHTISATYLGPDTICNNIPD